MSSAVQRTTPLGDYVVAILQGPKDKRKTEIWMVENTVGTRLGTVMWFSRWRCYAFFPAENSVFEKDCLRRIAEFVEAQTVVHRRRKK